MAEIIKRVKFETPQNKIKRSKNDLIKNIINNFLRRRNYTELHANHSPLTMTKEQMAVLLQTDKDSARCNSILYSSINNEPQQIVQHFEKWLHWLSKISAPNIQLELWVLARPLLCHLHLEALRGDHRNQTATLLKLHEKLNEKNNERNIQDDSIKNDISAKVLEKLANISTIQDIESYPVVMTFRSCKYQIKLSSKAVQVLMDYLTKQSHVIMLQVLQTWFDIEIIIDKSEPIQHFEIVEMSESEDDQTEGENYEQNTTTNEVEHGEEIMETIDDESLLRELEECSAQLENVKPSILMYNIYNDQNKCAVSCANVSQQMQYVSAGFENSEIRVWCTAPGWNTLLSTAQPSTVSLACTEENYAEVPIRSASSTILRGHSQNIQDVHFLQTIPLLLSVSHDSTMRVWSLEDNRCKAIYIGHQYPIWCLDTSVLDMYIVTGSQDRSVRIWSPESIHPLRLCAGHTLDVHSVKFHPNGLYIASGSSDRTVRLWNVSDASLVRLMTVQRAVYALDFSPDGKYLASGGEDKKIQIWDLASGDQLVELKGHTETITSLQWTSDGKYLTSAALDGTVRLWDSEVILKASSTELEPSMKFENTAKSIVSLQNIMDQLVCVGTD